MLNPEAAISLAGILHRNRRDRGTLAVQGNNVPGSKIVAVVVLVRIAGR